HMPVLYPGDPAEALDLGLHAVALSRATGLWAALKVVSDVADGTATLELDPDRVRPVLPGGFERRPEARLLAPRSLELEREIIEGRYPLAIRYAAENDLNRAIVDPADAWIGIVASGITYREVRAALHRLGLDSDAKVAACGIRVLRMLMPIPFDPRTLRHFARGLEEVFVVEEKQPNLELLIKDALYALPDRPRVVGKTDEGYAPLLPAPPAPPSRPPPTRTRPAPPSHPPPPPRGPARAAAAAPSRGRARRGAAHALLLLRLPAQPQHRGAARRARRRRDRLPHDGAPDG